MIKYGKYPPGSKGVVGKVELKMPIMKYNAARAKSLQVMSRLRADIRQHQEYIASLRQNIIVTKRALRAGGDAERLAARLRAYELELRRALEGIR